MHLMRVTFSIVKLEVGVGLGISNLSLPRNLRCSSGFQFIVQLFFATSSMGNSQNEEQLFILYIIDN